MNFIEQTESWSAEQFAAAERQIEEKKLEWEQNRLAAMKEEQERRARELEEENELLTFSREDANNQVSTKLKKLSSRRENVAQRRSNFKKDPEKLNRSKRQRTQVDSPENPPPPKKHKTGTSSESEEHPSETEGDSETSQNKMDANQELNISVVPDQKIKTNNSPRTRSRGTVAINLWTLDVSPILPGIKPFKREKNEKDCKEDEDKKSNHINTTEDKTADSENKSVKLRGRPRRKIKHKILSRNDDQKEAVVNNHSEEITETKTCKIVLTDVMKNSKVISHNGSIEKEEIDIETSITGTNITLEQTDPDMSQIDDKNESNIILEKTVELKNNLLKINDGECSLNNSHLETSNNMENGIEIKRRIQKTQRNNKLDHKQLKKSKTTKNQTLDSWLISSSSPNHSVENNSNLEKNSHENNDTKDEESNQTTST